VGGGNHPHVGLDRFAAAEPLERLSLQKANYDRVALVNPSGTVVERYSYDPFGTVTYMTGGYGSRSSSSYSWIYGFQGGRLDTITGDNHFGARNEDPATGCGFGIPHE
jgi:hypothetical protein